MKAGHSLSLGSECQRGGGWETGVEEGKRERMLMVETKQPLQQTTEKKKKDDPCLPMQTIGEKGKKGKRKRRDRSVQEPFLVLCGGTAFSTYTIQQ